jgi:hypothetical protein
MSFRPCRDTSKHYPPVSIEFSDNFLFVIATVPISASYVLGIVYNFVMFVLKHDCSCVGYVGVYAFLFLYINSCCLNLIYISVTFASSGMEFHGSPPDGRKQNYENGVP